MVGISIAFGIILILALLAFFKANLHICHPNEILVFSGRKRKDAKGEEIGYRVIKGGRGLKIPIVESVTKIPLNTIPIEITLHGALTNGVIPIDIEAMANIKIAGNEKEGLFNALERFLGKNVSEISLIAKENIEGALRGVLATLSPEEANSKRLQFSKAVFEEAQKDLKSLGLVLDTFKILHVSDKKGYLEAIGRKRNAEVVRDAKIVEANAEAEARSVAAEAKKKGRIAEEEADISIVEAENRVRIRRAELAKEAHIYEAEAAFSGEIARAEQEEKQQEIRIAVNRKKTLADIVVPAEAEKEALELRARGKAAKIVENGKAMALAVNSMHKEWAKEENRELFLIQQLPDILDKVTRVLSENMQIEKVTIVDSGNGLGIPSYVNGLAGSIVAVFEQVKNATGLDIPGILKNNGKVIDRMPE